MRWNTICLGYFVNIILVFAIRSQIRTVKSADQLTSRPSLIWIIPQTSWVCPFSTKLVFVFGLQIRIVPSSEQLASRPSSSWINFRIISVCPFNAKFVFVFGSQILSINSLDQLASRPSLSWNTFRQSLGWNTYQSMLVCFFNVKLVFVFKFQILGVLSWDQLASRPSSSWITPRTSSVCPVNVKFVVFVFLLRFCSASILRHASHSHKTVLTPEWGNPSFWFEWFQFYFGFTPWCQKVNPKSSAFYHWNNLPVAHHQVEPHSKCDRCDR